MGSQLLAWPPIPLLAILEADDAHRPGSLATPGPARQLLEGAARPPGRTSPGLPMRPAQDTQERRSPRQKACAANHSPPWWLPGCLIRPNLSPSTHISNSPLRALLLLCRALSKCDGQGARRRTCRSGYSRVPCLVIACWPHGNQSGEIGSTVLSFMVDTLDRGVCRFASNSTASQLRLSLFLGHDGPGVRDTTILLSPPDQSVQSVSGIGVTGRLARMARFAFRAWTSRSKGEQRESQDTLLFRSRTRASADSLIWPWAFGGPQRIMPRVHPRHLPALLQSFSIFPALVRASNLSRSLGIT